MKNRGSILAAVPVKFMIKIVVAFFVIHLNGVVWADVQPCHIFSDHAVIQRDREVAIWGVADEGEVVTVQFNGQKESATAHEGRWSIQLKPMPANSHPQSMKISGNNEITIQDLLIGDVWICAGQSNMEWYLQRCNGGEEAISQSENNQLRLGSVTHNPQLFPRTDAPIAWFVSNPQSSKNYSGIAYWFGSKLQKKLNIPIGIIRSTWGGTAIQSWMSAETLGKGPWPQNKDYSLKQVLLERDQAGVKSNQESLSNPPSESTQDHKIPSTLWNGMIYPLLNYTVSGVLWYQGENNTYEHLYGFYQELLPLFIHDWREGAKRSDLPFIIFQISRFKKPDAKETTVKTDYDQKSLKARIRESQLKTRLSTEKTALVVTIDLAADDGNVHYPNKEPAADRGLNAVLGIAYSQTSVFEGPAFVKSSVENDKIYLQFSNIGSGLVLKSTPTSGFTIAGEDRKFKVAQAVVQGDFIIVSHPEVKNPMAVRYAWGDFPDISLFNKDGLPSSPFRTDEWEIQK